MFPKTELDKTVQSKGNGAQDQEDPGGVPVVFPAISTSLGETDEQSDEHQQHVPDQRMDGQEPVIQQQARRFSKGNSAAQEVIQHHKAVHRPPKPTGSHPGNDQAQVHGDTAQLEGELTPAIPVILQDEEVKQLLEHLRGDQKQTQTKQDRTGGPVADPAQFPRSQTADSKAQKGIQNMKGAIGGDPLHRPGHGFKNCIQNIEHWEHLLFLSDWSNPMVAYSRNDNKGLYQFLRNSTIILYVPSHKWLRPVFLIYRSPGHVAFPVANTCSLRFWYPMTSLSIHASILIT